MKIKMIILFCLVIIANSISAQDAISESDAIRIALENNYSIIIARNSHKIAENNQDLGTAGFLPGLNASGGWQLSKSTQETNSPFSFGTSVNRNLNGLVSLDWTLFDGFTMFTNRAKYNELANASYLQTRSIIESTVINVLRAYYNVIRQQLLLDVAKDILNISSSRLSQSKLRGEIGGFSSSDILNAQVSFNNDRSVALRQEIALEEANRAFNLALGRDTEAIVKVKRDIPVVPLGIPADELVEQTLENNPDLNVARLSVKIADYDVTNARAGYMPKVSGSASYGISDRLTDSNSPRFTDDIKTTSTDMAVGVSLSWNLFNGMRNSVAIQNAALAKKNKEIQLANLNEQVKASIYNLVTALNKQLLILEIESQNQEAARQNLEVIQGRMELGAATSLEFRDAQVNYARARNNEILARHEARITRLEIDRVSGRLKLALSIEAN